MDGDVLPNGNLELSHQDGVAELRLSNPEKLNCVSLPHVEDLLTAIERLEGYIEDDELVSILITHEGEQFCGGYDLDVMAADGREAEKQQLQDQYQACYGWLRNVDVPVVVGARGAAVAAGAVYCLTGDIIVTGPDFRMWWSEVNVGIFGYTIGPLFVNRVGHRRAAELAFLGNNAKLTPQEARELGLINRIVDGEEVENEAREIAETLAEYERRYGYILDAYEVYNLSKRANRNPGGIGHAEAEWRTLYDEWFNSDGIDTRLGGEDDPRRGG